MRICSIVVAFVLTSSIAALADEIPMPNINQAQTAFAVDLYAQLRSTPGNLFFSPYSIATAISMTRDGARGTTAEQIDKTLHFAGGTTQSDAAIAAFIKDLNDHGGEGEREMYKLVTANAMWLQNNYPILPVYTERIRTAFGGKIQNVDFAANPEQSRATINKWVADQTADKIKDLLPASAIQPSIRFVLTNAIYFKSAWQNEFAKTVTEDAPFHATDGDVTVSMMHARMATAYFENDQVQMVSLPYLGHSLDMVVILPKKADGLAEVESSFAADALNAWLGKLNRAEVTIALPRMKMATTLQLSKTLTAMGMVDAFSLDHADFSGISASERIAIGDVIHQATLDVDEHGTEAAAATAMVMVGSARVQLEEKTFTADHPFILLIRQQRMNTILFMGRCANPKV